MNRRKFGQLMGAALATPAWARVGIPAREKVRFSFMLWALEKQVSFDRALEIVSEAGYQGVELVGEFKNWSPDQKQRIKARMRSLGLVVDAMSGVKAGFAVPEDAELFRTQFTEHLAAAKELECPQVILLSGRRVAGLDTKAQYNVSVENLKWAAEVAAKEQIQIVIEPIDLLENPDDISGECERWIRHCPICRVTPGEGSLRHLSRAAQLREPDRKAREEYRFRWPGAYRGCAWTARAGHGRDRLWNDLPQAGNARL